MENKPKFNKELFTTIALQEFLKNYRRSKQNAEERKKQAEFRKQADGSNKIDNSDEIEYSIKVDDAYKNLLNLNKNNPEKIQILKNCKNLFEADSTQKKVDFEIATIHTEINTTKGRNPTDSEIAKRLIKCFSEEIFATNKRTYDMSQIASNGMLSTVKTPQGKTLKVVAYVSWEEQLKKRNQANPKRKPPEKLLKDKHGNTIHIQFMGCLAYRTPASNQYIYKHRITKTIDGVKQEPIEKFSNIDIFEMDYDKEYCNLVVSELLSEKNINCSNANDYIGEISEEASLKPGEEKLEPGFYTYQMSPKYALVYNGERIEAIRAYKQQEAMKKAKSADPKKENDEPEL